MNGKLITIEGIDGSGKSTILARLKQHFRDDPGVLFTREPTSGWIGEAVHRAIKSRTDPLAELFLFIADHADHISSIIRPALEKNINVISDRYSDSRYAYQGVTLAGLIENPMEWVMELHKGWTVVPDKTILLDLSPDAAISRMGKRDHQTKFEKISFLEQVRKNYLKLADMDPGRYILVDAIQDADAVEQTVLDVLKQHLAQP